MNYMIMQAYDFYVLHKKYNCVMELGGDDQWSNMIAGVELIRRKDRQPAFCMTNTLLTNSQGQKMGKTVGGAVWLSAEKPLPLIFINTGETSMTPMWKMPGSPDLPSHG